MYPCTALTYNYIHVHVQFKFTYILLLSLLFFFHSINVLTVSYANVLYTCIFSMHNIHTYTHVHVYNVHYFVHVNFTSDPGILRLRATLYF